MFQKSRTYQGGQQPVEIGPICVRPALALAPMAGITSHPFRVLVKERGCGLVFSEMIHARALLNESRYGLLSAYFHERERPVGLQLFGSQPEELAGAAWKMEALGADLVDLNLGCPTPRIMQNGEGGALMRQPQLCSAIFKAVAGSVACPVTIKLRKGWDDHLVNAVEIARRAEEAGIAAVTVHGRTVAQGFSGKADWGIIKAVKSAVSIPVIGNGDIASADDALAMMESSGCDGVMIGRAALGNPWIFEQVAAGLERAPAVGPPSLRERVQTVLRHLNLLCAYKGDAAALREMRRQAGWYLKGLPGAAAARRRLATASTAEVLRAIIQDVMVPGEH